MNIIFPIQIISSSEEKLKARHTNASESQFRRSNTLSGETILSQSEIYKYVFLPLLELCSPNEAVKETESFNKNFNKTFNKKSNETVKSTFDLNYFCTVIIQFMREVYEAELTPLINIQHLILKLIFETKNNNLLHSLLQFHVIHDSSELAGILIEFDNCELNQKNYKSNN